MKEIIKTFFIALGFVLLLFGAYVAGYVGVYLLFELGPIAAIGAVFLFLFIVVFKMVYDIRNDGLRYKKWKKQIEQTKTDGLKTFKKIKVNYPSLKEGACKSPDQQRESC